MTREIKITSLQNYTKLPLEVILIADKVVPTIVVNTPHKGRVGINITKKHYPFIFGSVTQTDKYAEELIEEIIQLEEESTDYLLAQWLNNQ